MRNWLITIAISFSLMLFSCIGEGKLKGQFNSQPRDRHDGWLIANAGDEGIPVENIENAYRRIFSENEFPTAISLLVIRNGKLVAEGYTRDEIDHFVYEHTQSVTKSFTSLVFGIVQANGYFPDLEQTLYSFIPEYFPQDEQKRNITLKHLFTMKSGIDFLNDNFAIEMMIDKPKDQTRYILNKPMFAAPGAEFLYRDCDPQLISDVVQRVTAKTLEQWAQEKLFAPMEISYYKWLKNIEGNSFGPYGIYMHPRDLAKIGLLVLQGGVWEGEQLIPSSWIIESTQQQTQIDDNPSTAGFAYGYYWWIVPELNAFTAWGHGGNFIFIVPDKNLILVYTAEPDAGDDAATKLKQFIPIVEIILTGVD